MNYKWILGLIFLLGCSSSKNVAEEKVNQKLAIELVSSTKKGEYVDFEFAMINNTKTPVTILKHRGLNEREKYDVALAGAFYNMEFLPYSLMCEYEMMFMDQVEMDRQVFKTSTDFVTIGSKEKYLFSVRSEDYQLGVCDKNATEFKVVMKYEPREQYFQKEYFDIKFKLAKDSQQYFDKLGKSLQSTIVSDTIIIKF